MQCTAASSEWDQECGSAWRFEAGGGMKDATGLELVETVRPMETWNK